MHDDTRAVLAKVARQYGTPSYVYLVSQVRRRVGELLQVFGDRFKISYAAKANPNVAILSLFRQLGLGLDVSSIGEMSRGLDAGFAPVDIGFTGPAKRSFELQLAIRQGIGEIVCESADEIDEVNRIASSLGVIQPILLRINPVKVPRKFGLQMAGQPSQFGIDEENLSDLFPRLTNWSAIRYRGLHAYSAGNSLVEDAIIENLLGLARLFTRITTELGREPEKLVFGSGFGIPYFEGDQELNLTTIGAEINPAIDEIRLQKNFRNTAFGLEMGRWLIGGAGYMLTSVIRCKTSRGREIRMCDAGFNNNLSAAGMMGTVMRRDWRFWNLDARETDEQETYLLVGPLCASFDVLGNQVSLPPTKKGHVLAIGSSGAYGLTASPTRFISHPEPGEYLVDEIDNKTLISDVTESRMNRPDSFHQADHSN